MPPALQWDLVEESFAEAAFLWARWEDAWQSPRHDLDGVVHWVEERLIGALDGVRLGAQRAFDELLVPALRARHHRSATVAAYVLASMGRSGIEHVVAAMVDAKPDRLVALRRGLEHAPGAQWPSIVAEYVARMSADVQAAVLDAYAFRRWPTPPGMDAQIDRNAKPVQLASLRLAAAVKDAWTQPYIDWAAQRSDARLRVEAARAALVRGHPDASARAGELIRTKTAGVEPLLPLVVLARGERLLPMLQAQLQAGEGTREVFDALWCIGTIEAADVCASLLEHDRFARLAADALRAITGIDPTPPPDTARQPEDLPRDELLLPQPEPGVVREAWQKRREHYAAKQRYLLGRPFDPAQLPTLLASAPMRRRHLLAAELCMRSQGAMQITTIGWTKLQRAQLGAAVVPESARPTPVPV
ncbi:MAG TPA: hypothetical protein VG755_03985 [Nannocystaceae bacterium]|nr:hypothetical protein [Nannocystaceae bacterium]